MIGDEFRYIIPFGSSFPDRDDDYEEGRSSSTITFYYWFFKKQAIDFRDSSVLRFAKKLPRFSVKNIILFFWCRLPDYFNLMMK